LGQEKAPLSFAKAYVLRVDEIMTRDPVCVAALKALIENVAGVERIADHLKPRDELPL
jgi:hypothetical protein